MIKVTGGNSNLFLINPAGIIFGKDATLDLRGSFTATTANGIQIGEYWFDALGNNDYSKLSGDPNGFAFATDTPGSIVNAGKINVINFNLVYDANSNILDENGDIAVDAKGNKISTNGNIINSNGVEIDVSGKEIPTSPTSPTPPTPRIPAQEPSSVRTINLVGGLVINTGTLTAPEGNINITAVPGKQLVKISPEGSLLSLGLPTDAANSLSSSAALVTPQALPELLTGGDLQQATEVEIADNGAIKLTGNDNKMPNEQGTAIISGGIDTSKNDGGTKKVGNSSVVGNKIFIQNSGISGNTILTAKEQISFNDNDSESGSYYDFDRLTAIVDPG